MAMPPMNREVRIGAVDSRLLLSWLCILGMALATWARPASAQDDPLNNVHVQPHTDKSAPATEPAGAEAPPDTGAAAMRAHPGSFIRLETDLVLVPVTVTDPMNRLVTGLERNDFKVYDDSTQQKITSFSSEDAPVSIGIIFDLTGSMNSKLVRAKDAILSFIK